MLDITVLAVGRDAIKDVRLGGGDLVRVDVDVIDAVNAAGLVDAGALVVKPERANRLVVDKPLNRSTMRALKASLLECVFEGGRFVKKAKDAENVGVIAQEINVIA